MLVLIFEGQCSVKHNAQLFFSWKFFLLEYFTFWEFHLCIQCILIIFSTLFLTSPTSTLQSPYGFPSLSLKKLVSLISAAHILRCGAFYWNLIGIPDATPLKPDVFSPRNDHWSIAPQLGVEVPEPLPSPCWNANWFDVVQVLWSCWESMSKYNTPVTSRRHCFCLVLPDHYTQGRHQSVTDWLALLDPHYLHLPFTFASISSIWIWLKWCRNSDQTVRMEQNGG